MKKLPELKTDNDAEDFIDTADLTEYDLSVLMPMKFEFQKRTQYYFTFIRPVARSHQTRSDPLKHAISTLYSPDIGKCGAFERLTFRNKNKQKRLVFASLPFE